jgi:NADH-quinone oxidoreductase subunit M
MGGLWEKAPVIGAMGLIFSMASLGLPGLGNFIAELLILIGAFKASVLMSCLASLGLIAATIYSLRIVQKVFLGNKNRDWEMNDLTVREKIVTGSLVIVIVGLGLFPKPVFNIAKPALLKTLDSQKEKSIQDVGSNSCDTRFCYPLPNLPPRGKESIIPLCGTGKGVNYVN